MTEPGNAWLLALDQRPVALRVECWRDRRRAPRLVAAVVHWCDESGLDRDAFMRHRCSGPEVVAMLHRPDGVGHELNAQHAPLRVPCRCGKTGHLLDQGKVLAAAGIADVSDLAP